MPADDRWDLIWRLNLILLTWKIWWAPNNASRWQMGINSAFNALRNCLTELYRAPNRQALCAPYNLWDPYSFRKFQMAPRLKICMASGSKRGTQNTLFSLKRPGKRTSSRFPNRAPMEREARLQGILRIPLKPQLDGKFRVSKAQWYSSISKGLSFFAFCGFNHFTSCNTRCINICW